jgi:hypothetical protein
MSPTYSIAQTDEPTKLMTPLTEIENMLTLKNQSFCHPIFFLKKNTQKY